MISEDEVPSKNSDILKIIRDERSVENLRYVRNAIHNDFCESIACENSAIWGLKWWRVVNNEIYRKELLKTKDTHTRAIIEINGKYHATAEIRKSDQGDEDIATLEKILDDISESGPYNTINVTI